MGIVTIDDINLTNIANAIRDKKGTSDVYKPSEMASAILDISEGNIKPEGNIDITTTDEYDVTNYATAKIKDDNLKAENIAENVEILGLKGTFKGGVDTSDATATSDDLLLGKTAYVNEEKLTGTIETWDGTFEGDVELYRPLNEYIGGSKTDITKKDLEGINRIREHCFYNQPITSIDIPQNITSIGMHAFSVTKSLKNVIIPDSVTGIGDRAFYQSGIITLVLSNTISHVPNYLARECQSLTSITFGRGTTYIAGSALNVTPSLKEIICLAETPPSLSSNFSTNEDCIIKVPTNSVEAYKAATNWNARADYIIAYEEV